MKSITNAKISKHDTIYKYPLVINVDTLMNKRAVKIGVAMPSGAVPIHFGRHGQDLCVWAMVNVRAQEAKHHFEMIGTGGPLGLKVPEDHVGTIIEVAGYVWHLFYLGEEP